MREIKFRAWNKLTKNMVDLYKITPLILNADVNGLFIPFSEHHPLMQYAGLKDKNGKEIYEGDIVQSGNKRIWEVRFGIFQYIGQTYHGFSMYSSNCEYPLCYGSSSEVIGNIYQNPELLEAK
jgi:uncharacterized phage protein (TIGR01671 family)